MSDSLFLGKKENVSLLININNGSINTALVHFKHGKVPDFLYSIETPFIGEKSDFTELPDGMLSILESSLKEMATKGWHKITLKNKKISHVVVSLSSPWFVLRTKNIHLFQDHTFVITEKFIDDITKKEEELFKKELLLNYSNDNREEFSIIEKSVIHTKMNGYIVENILGKKTKDFDVSVFVSAVSKKIEERITKIIFKETHIPKENFMLHSFPMVLFSTTRDHFSTDSNFILINIDSETTDLILIQNHVISSVASFPFGKNTIIRYLADSFKISPEIAESQLTMCLSNKIDDTSLNSIRSALEELEKEWAIYFEDALLSLSPKMVWPKKTFIMVEKGASQIFVDFISLQKSDATSSFRKHAEIKLIDDNILSNLYVQNFHKEINKSLIVLADFYNKLFHIQNSSF